MDIVKLLRETGKKLSKHGFVHYYDEAADEIVKLRLKVKEQRRVARAHIGALRILHKGKKS